MPRDFGTRLKVYIVAVIFGVASLWMLSTHVIAEAYTAIAWQSVEARIVDDERTCDGPPPCVDPEHRHRRSTWTPPNRRYGKPFVTLEWTTSAGETLRQRLKVSTSRVGGANNFWRMGKYDLVRVQVRGGEPSTVRRPAPIALSFLAVVMSLVYFTVIRSLFGSPRSASSGFGVIALPGVLGVFMIYASLSADTKRSAFEQRLVRVEARVTGAVDRCALLVGVLASPKQLVTRSDWKDCTRVHIEEQRVKSRNRYERRSATFLELTYTAPGVGTVTDWRRADASGVIPSVGSTMTLIVDPQRPRAHRVGVRARPDFIASPSWLKLWGVLGVLASIGLVLRRVREDDEPDELDAPCNPWSVDGCAPVPRQTESKPRPFGRRPSAP